MANLWYGHFDSAPGDQRKLTAVEWARYISSFITNGVRNGGTNLQVVANTSMMVKVAPGMANINGYIVISEEDFNGTFYNVLLQDAHPQFPRIDRIVAQLDLSQETRKITLRASMGVASASPVPPNLKREGYLYEISLAQVRVNANTLAITDENITDERLDPELCGLINSILGVDSSLWQAQFDTFMEATDDERAALFAQFESNYQQAESARQAEFDLNKTTNQTAWDTWFSNIKIDPQRYISFNFDNLAALPGTEKLTSFPTGTMLEVITVTGSSAKVAERELTFGTMTTTERVYNDVGIVIRPATIKKTFPSGTIKDVVTV